MAGSYFNTGGGGIGSPGMSQQLYQTLMQLLTAGPALTSMAPRNNAAPSGSAPPFDAQKSIMPSAFGNGQGVGSALDQLMGLFGGSGDDDLFGDVSDLVSGGDGLSWADAAAPGPNQVEPM
jgi:hypothetical protein